MKGSLKRNSKQVETPPRVVSRGLPVRQRLPVKTGASKLFIVKSKVRVVLFIPFY